MPDEGNAAALVAAFAARGPEATAARILYPASSRALPTIAAGLRQLGAEVTQVEAYRTGSAPLDVAACRDWIARDGVAAVTFASPSAVSELAEALGHSDFDRLLHGGRRGRHRAHHRARAERARTPGRHRGRRDARGTCGHYASLTGDEILTMAFPNTRPRRTRQSDPWRRLVRETHLRPEGLVYPLFAVPGRAVRRAVESMPGIFQLSVDEAARHAREVAATGVPAVLVFAAPDHKDAQASNALDPKGLAAQTISAIKEACPQLLVSSFSAIASTSSAHPKAPRPTRMAHLLSRVQHVGGAVQSRRFPGTGYVMSHHLRHMVRERCRDRRLLIDVID